MRVNRRFMALGLAGLALAGLVAAGCSQAPGGAAAAEPAVKVEKNAETGISRVALSAKAAERLGIATAVVSASASGGGMTMPYAALFYDNDGKTWVYTNPEGLVFLRHEVEVDRIDGDTAILSAGPPVGAVVVTVGTAELWGAETGVGGGK